jgi:phosphatidylinositol glycan class T
MTHLPRRILYPFLLLLFHILFSAIAFGSVLHKAGEEEFSEELLLRPLPDRKVLAYFHFETRAPSSLSDSYGRHHHLFPKAIAQLVCFVLDLCLFSEKNLDSGI